jgi:putative N6-adenine-specific DNA methylase
MPENTEQTKLSEAGLARRLKRHLLKAPQEFFAVTTPGLEAPLESEIKILTGAVNLRKVNGGVEFGGPLELVYDAALRLRTANRLLMRVDSFVARSYPELFNKARRIPWELYTGFTTDIDVDAVSRTSRLHHTDNIEKAVFDGIVDRMRTLDVAVSLHPEDPDLRFSVRLSDDTCTISVDAGGQYLYKRGYRQEIGHAPLRESITAALLSLAHYEKHKIIADPFCGSGTFAIEAACMARAIAPGLDRAFGFFSWPSLNRGVWERTKQRAIKETKPGCQTRILASDISTSSIDAARNNAGRAMVAENIEFQTADCFEFNRIKKLGNNGLIISNLPYGKRAFADSRSLNDFYKKWGEHLRNYCKSWHYGFLLSDLALARKAGLSVKDKISFENGGIEVHFVQGKIN